MKEWNSETEAALSKANENILIFIHTPFCATCQLAEKMLHIIEQTNPSRVIYKLNASLHPNFMKKNKLESVPALVLWNGTLQAEPIYKMESVTNLYQIVEKWEQK